MSSMVSVINISTYQYRQGERVQYNTTDIERVQYNTTDIRI